MIQEFNIEAGLKIIVDFIDQEAKETLDDKEQAIISGCLAGLTYKEIKQESAILRNLTLEYIAGHLAYKLWKRLNEIFNRSRIANQKIKVSKNQLWYAIEEITNLKITNNKLQIDPLPPKLLEGKVLRGRYEITEYLFDRDLTERHFRGIDRDLGNQACWVVQLVPGSQSIQNRFEREAGILSKLGNHRQIPQLLAYFTEERYYYLIYEYIEGEPLTNRFMEDEPWQEAEVVFFLQDILSVLEFIHQHDLVHRNLNPDSLIQQPDGKVVPVDFATVKQIAIFYNPASDYSNNLKFKLKQTIRNQKIDITKEFNIADDHNFSTRLALQEAKNKGTNVFILLPDGQETNALAKAMELIQADNGNTIILSGSPLVNSKIEQIKTDLPIQLIATSFWHPLVDPQGIFTKTSQQLWGTKINGTTATAYDANLAFIEAIKLQNNPTRKGILNQLSTEGFSFYGATGHTRFNNPINGDRVNFFPTLVHLVPCKNSDRFYEFVPIKYADAQAAGLNCNLN